MPVYEYRCSHCGHTFSKLQNISAQGTKTPCPECAHEEVERLLSAFASCGSKTAGSGPSCAASSGFS